MSLSITEHNGGVRLIVKVVPGSSRDRIAGVLGDALKISVSAPPQRGEANRAVIALLAEKLGIHPSQISVVRGQTSPRKELRITGITAQEIAAALGI